MEIYIDKFEFWGLEAMKYWSHPKSYDIKRKKEEAKNMATSGNFIGSRKMDGQWLMIIKDMEGNFHARSRTESVNGGFSDKADWIPHICKELFSMPNGTVLLGELYFPNNEGSRKVTSVFNCLKEKCIERQEKNGYLHFYVFDVLAYNGKSLINTAIEERLNRYLYYELLDVLKNNSYIEIAEYKEGEELWNLYGEVIAAGGEGIVITRKDCKYLCGKRTARMSLKLKKELEETIDAFYDGNFKLPDPESNTEHPETWQWWYNQKTGEKTDRCKYEASCAGEAWIPIKKAAFFGWPSAISFSVLKDGQSYHIGYISSLPDDVRASIAENPSEWVGKVAELQAMEIQQIDGKYTLRHAKILQWRDSEKTAQDCDFSQISQN